MGRIKRKILCPICGNETPINPKYKYHKCFYCRTDIRLKYYKDKIVGAEENIRKGNDK